MSTAGKNIDIEVVYAGPDSAVRKAYRLESPATVADALRLAAADPVFAHVDLTASAVGIFGLIARLDQLLVEGDRIEIYRDLAADPKTARRARVKQARRRA
jgi:putative ubiquitin-RnfH superfamily antitoxin RatB of RatAB toxin-antitoxin module